MTIAIELRGVSKQVGGETHIHPTTLALQPGGFNILLGTTLAGKTTLMRLMAGLEPPSAGRIDFDGRDVTGVAVQRREVAMVYQAFINYPNLTVYENIASPLKVARLPDAEIHSRVQAMAELLQLGAFLDRLPGELSGGQQQRTALARALVKRAPLVLLDEPLANLDYKLREELREELPKLFRNRDTTVVYATSEPDEALLLGGHTATLHAGRVTQFGPTAEIYRAPNTLLSAQIFSDPPINTAEIEKHGPTFHLSEAIVWPVPERIRGIDDGTYQIALRPHHLTVANGQREGLRLDGTVQVAEISGSESLIHTDVAGRHWISQTPGVHDFAVGSKARFDVQLERCLYFSADGERLA